MYTTQVEAIMQPSTQRPLPLIYLNALPGTGKLTIARLLVDKINAAAASEQRPDGEPVAKLVHNHLLINPAHVILPRTDPGYQKLRRALRAAVFTSLSEEPGTYNHVYIFTDFQSGDAIGSSVCEQFRAAAKARSCELIPVILSCAEDENLRRLTSGERSSWHKLTDKELLLTLRQKQDSLPVYDFSDMPTRLVLDVTNTSADAAAECIMKHVLRYINATPGTADREYRET